MFEGNGGLAGNLLRRLAIHNNKYSPQCSMTIDKQLERPPQGRRIHLAFEAQNARDGISSTLRRKLLQKPERLLALRQRILHCPCNARNQCRVFFQWSLFPKRKNVLCQSSDTPALQQRFL